MSLNPFNPKSMSTGPTVSATLVVKDSSYLILTSGDTDWTSIGSPNNDPGTSFTATGTGSGTGTARASTNGDLGIKIGNDMIPLNPGSYVPCLGETFLTDGKLAIPIEPLYSGVLSGDFPLISFDSSIDREPPFTDQAGLEIAGPCVSPYNWSETDTNLKTIILDTLADVDASVEEKARPGYVANPGLILSSKSMSIIASDIDVKANQIRSSWTCQIKTPGSTNWIAIGSPNNDAGTEFTATGPGTGDGIATHLQGGYDDENGVAFIWNFPIDNQEIPITSTVNGRRYKVTKKGNGSRDVGAEFTASGAGTGTAKVTLASYPHPALRTGSTRYSYPETLKVGTQFEGTRNNPKAFIPGAVGKFTSGILKICGYRYGCLLGTAEWYVSVKIGKGVATWDAGAKTLTLVCPTEGSTIYYSTDGTTPSLTYSAPISITETKTVRWYASKLNSDSTPVKMMLDSDEWSTSVAYTGTTPPANFETHYFSSLTGFNNSTLVEQVALQRRPTLYLSPTGTTADSVTAGNLEEPGGPSLIIGTTTILGKARGARTITATKSSTKTLTLTSGGSSPVVAGSVVSARIKYAATRVETAATGLAAGDICVISEVGNTPWTSIGASANLVGYEFVATGPGTGTGKAQVYQWATYTTPLTIGPQLLWIRLDRPSATLGDSPYTRDFRLPWYLGDATLKAVWDLSEKKLTLSIDGLDPVDASGLSIWYGTTTSDENLYSEPITISTTTTLKIALWHVAWATPDDFSTTAEDWSLGPIDPASTPDFTNTQTVTLKLAGDISATPPAVDLIYSGTSTNSYSGNYTLQTGTFNGKAWYKKGSLYLYWYVNLTSEVGRWILSNTKSASAAGEPTSWSVKCTQDTPGPPVGSILDGTWTSNPLEDWQHETVNWQVNPGSGWSHYGYVNKTGATKIRIHFHSIDSPSPDQLYAYTDAGWASWVGSYVDQTPSGLTGSQQMLYMTTGSGTHGSFVIDRVDWAGTSTTPASTSGSMFSTVVAHDPPPTPDDPVTVFSCARTAASLTKTFRQPPDLIWAQEGNYGSTTNFYNSETDLILRGGYDSTYTKRDVKGTKSEFKGLLSGSTVPATVISIPYGTIDGIWSGSETAYTTSNPISKFFEAKNLYNCHARFSDKTQYNASANWTLDLMTASGYCQGCSLDFELDKTLIKPVPTDETLATIKFSLLYTCQRIESSVINVNIKTTCNSTSSIADISGRTRTIGKIGSNNDIIMSFHNQISNAYLTPGRPHPYRNAASCILLTNDQAIGDNNKINIGIKCEPDPVLSYRPSGRAMLKVPWGGTNNQFTYRTESTTCQGTEDAWDSRGGAEGYSLVGLTCPGLIVKDCTLRVDSIIGDLTIVPGTYFGGGYLNAYGEIAFINIYWNLTTPVVVLNTPMTGGCQIGTLTNSGTGAQSFIKQSNLLWPASPVLYNPTDIQLTEDTPPSPVFWSSYSAARGNPVRRNSISPNTIGWYGGTVNSDGAPLDGCETPQGTGIALGRYWE